MKIHLKIVCNTKSAYPAFFVYIVTKKDKFGTEKKCINYFYTEKTPKFLEKLLYHLL